MPITANIVLELISRHEGPILDFKVTQYNWNNEGNLELAKDLMAIANGLSLVSPPGYILIGVDINPDQTGRLVGVEPTAHLDDANMHQKVKSILNRPPSFLYAPIEIDRLSIGVFEIFPGGRPYYPLKNRGNRNKLTRFEARIRIGSSTDVASPEQIQSWLREDEYVLRQQHVHDSLSRFLGFLVEAIEGNPFHWSKHVFYCEPLSIKLDTLRSIKTSIEAGSFLMNPLQKKCVIESAHETHLSFRSLSPAAFQLSGRHGILWISLDNSISQLAKLFPFKCDLQPLEKHPIIFGEDSFALAFCELVEHMILFEEARDTL